MSYCRFSNIVLIILVKIPLNKPTFLTGCQYQTFPFEKVEKLLLWDLKINSFVYQLPKMTDFIKLKRRIDTCRNSSYLLHPSIWTMKDVVEL